MAIDIAISAWIKTSFIDFPGVISTVLFLSGCNLRCPYCHNFGIVLGQHDESIQFDDIKDHIVNRKGVVEGAVISGGEPSIHSGLKNLCGELRALGVKVKIDTNGLEPDAIYDCRPDYLALDVKTSFDKYPLLKASRPGYRGRLSQTVAIAKSMGKNAEARITAVPGVVGRGDIDNLCAELHGVNKVYIQQFNPNAQTLDPAYSSVKPYGIDELNIWRKIFLDAGIECEIRNV
ncbi:MAG: anaerobic ribonucleoside-triphosphate reductase activating protein [Chitinispirillales bacterium]|jgi:pyruvate formate lyase activating enzyme|nr:anaerobic ribonucleoside-triphosphate reductase activating protein [Chitinispirillales bacterium]